METEQRIFESGRFVLLEEEVANPGKSVAHNRSQEQVPDVEGKDDSPQKLQHGKQSPNEVQPPVGPVGMLRHVERTELVQIFILLLFSHLIL